MLSLRFASGIVAVPILVAIAWFGGWPYAVTITLASLVAAWEVRGMLRARGYQPQDGLLFGLSGLLPLHAWVLASTQGPAEFASWAMIDVTVLMVAGLVLLLFRPQQDGALVDWSLSLGLALYLGGLMQFYVPMRARPDGAFWVLLLLGSSWVCDSTAFFVGRAFGRVRLAPQISPKKSVEGAVGGVMAAGLFAAAIGAVTGQQAALTAGYGVAIALASVAGDLVESMLKRQTGVKDSGNLVPGHGGLLDRMDSLLFCAPAAFLYLSVLAL